MLPFSLAAGEQRELILRMQTEGAANLSASLMSAEAFNHHEQRMLLLQGLFFGALLVMLIYNLSILASPVIATTSGTACLSPASASISLFSWDLPFSGCGRIHWLAAAEFPLSSALATLFGIYFTYGILDLKSQHPAYTWISRTLQGCSLLVWRWP